MEDEVKHVICDRITNRDDMMRSIGCTDLAVAPRRGGGASHDDGPDPRDPTVPKGRTLPSPPFGAVAKREEMLRIRSHDFH